MQLALQLCGCHEAAHAPVTVSRRELLRAGVCGLATIGAAALRPRLAQAEETKSFRNTQGIVTAQGDANQEADVIMTAAALGLAASYINESKNPLSFDMDPLELQKDAKAFARFAAIVGKMDRAVAAYLKLTRNEPGVKAGFSPDYDQQGAVIMGVYTLAGAKAPQSVSKPALSPNGRDLYKKIVESDTTLKQYKGRGAYSGFVDNHNTEGNGEPIGPLSTARFLAPAPGALDPDPHPRWLPPNDPGSPLWKKRKCKGNDTYVPWGMIGGGDAGNDPESLPESLTSKTNRADQITGEMERDNMVFNGNVTNADIAGYTHGMIQAIYKAYDLGPGCVPYEIAVGDKTKKMASCLPCTLFMHAAGYPPTSIHLGRGESWLPLYKPYDPLADGTIEPQPGDRAVIRDLNNAWYRKCLEWLNLGLDILDKRIINTSHAASRAAVKKYLTDNSQDSTVGGVLILDAVTIHESDGNRIDRTLRSPA